MITLFGLILTFNQNQSNIQKISPTLNPPDPSQSSIAINQPMSSLSLYQPNPNRKLGVHDFLSTINFSNYKISNGEAEQIFIISDKNKDDILEQSEWEGFVNIFIVSFEACDKNADYLLSEEEFKNCFQGDPISKLIKFRQQYEDNKYSLLISSISTSGKASLNIFDYLLLRRAMHAWKECHATPNFIRQVDFECAVRIVIPLQYHTSLDMINIYKVGLKLTNDSDLSELDFITYTKVLFYAYAFSILSEPTQIPYLTKTNMLKNIKANRLQIWLSEEDVKLFYELAAIDQNDERINFETFCFFFNTHRLFIKYSNPENRFLNKDEFMKLLNDEFMPVNIVKCIDFALTDFEEKDYKEISDKIIKLRVSERDYYSFLEQEIVNNPPEKHNLNNLKSREIFFSIHSSLLDKQYMSKENYFRALFWANVYANIEINKNIFKTSTIVQTLPQLYEKINPPVSQLQRDNFMIYNLLPNDINIDILLFCIIENHKVKFLQYQINVDNKKEFINETDLKILLKDYGMENMPDTFFDAMKGGNDVLGRRIYKPEELLINVVTIQAACSDNIRNKLLLN
jgi:hypothetical protein